MHPKRDDIDACYCAPPIFNSGPDYENTADRLKAAGWNVIYDNSATFVLPTTMSRPIIAYAGYGANHQPPPPSTGSYLQGFKFVPGAIFNTMESFNGRAFNGLSTLFNQETIAHFIHSGGTFGVGNVWEPFAFSVPDNDSLIGGMLLRGMTFAEAAWSSMPALSWQQIVVGDPLARVIKVIDQPADFNADMIVDDPDFLYLKDCATGPAMGPPVPGCIDADLNGDSVVDMIDFAAFQRCFSRNMTTLDANCSN